MDQLSRQDAYEDFASDTMQFNAMTYNHDTKIHSKYTS